MNGAPAIMPAVDQDYALLIGSIGLFAMIGAVMYLTRGVDWYGMKARDR